MEKAYNKVVSNISITLDSLDEVGLREGENDFNGSNVTVKSHGLAWS